MRPLQTIVQVDILIYSILLNIMMYGYLSYKDNRDSYSVILFKRILVSITLISFLETLSRALSGSLVPSHITMRYWVAVIFHSTNSLVASFGLAYLDYKLFRDNIKNKKRLFFYLIPTYINIAFCIYNHFSRGFLFMFDEYNIYHRGVGLTIRDIILYLCAIAPIAYSFKHSHLITERVVRAISLCIFIPLIGLIFQSSLRGLPLEMPACTLAAFATFIITEKDELSRDPLTFLYTRGYLENRLRTKLRCYKPFTIILIDLDDFKYINDTYGHLEGDLVLRKVAGILNKNIAPGDTVCRYGGDEFLVLIENNLDQAESFISQTKTRIDYYNKQAQKPYKIQLSYGCKFISDTKGITLESLITCVDDAMYQDKLSKK